MKSLAWAPDGRRLALLRSGTAVHVYFIDARTHVKIPRLDKAAGVAFSPDGRVLAIDAETKASGRGVYLLDQVDVVQGEARIHFASGAPVVKPAGWSDTRITFSPDGRRVLVVDRQDWVRPGFPAKGQRVYLADTATGEPRPLPPIIERADKERPLDFAWQPDGRIGGVLYMDGRRYGCLLDGETADLRRQEEDADDSWAPWLEPPCMSSRIARSVDGRRFAIAQGTAVRLYEFD
jgi:dipeptidyl aminopeptidase/acylaminoacyl peptidase